MAICIYIYANRTMTKPILKVPHTGYRSVPRPSTMPHSGNFPVKISSRTLASLICKF